MPNITKIPAPRVPLLDERTGLISREWFRFFNNIYVITGGETQGITQIVNGGTGADNAAQARANLGAGSGDGTVTRVLATGSASGLSLNGDVTTSGTITLSGTVVVSSGNLEGTIDIDTQTSGTLPIDTRTVGNLDVATRATGVLPTANGGTGMALTTIATKAADFTLADSEGWVINNKSGSTCTVTLPAASAWGGRAVTFKNLQAQTLVSATSNVAPIGSATPGTAILPATIGSWATVVSDGTNWVIMAS
jgi:hypothetical protein